MNTIRLLVVTSLLAATPGAAAPGAAPPQPRLGKPVPAPPGDYRLSPIEPAEIDDRLSIGGEDISARTKETRMTVAVQVNGSGPYQFLVDSGADTSVVGTRIAQKLNLPMTSPALLHGMAARSMVARVKVNDLRLGNSSFSDLELPALKESDLGGDGIVGIDALVNQRLLMDFDAKTIRVEDARTPARMVDGDIVVVARRRRGQLILTQVRAGKVKLEAVVDTGSQVTIGNNHLRKQLVRRGQDFITTTMTDVTGRTMPIQMTYIPELQIGSIKLENVPIAFADLPPFESFGMSNGPALLLGTDLLGNFRKVALDFKSRKVRFQLRRCNMGVEISTNPSGPLSRLSSDNRAACSDA